MRTWKTILIGAVLSLLFSSCERLNDPSYNNPYNGVNLTTKSFELVDKGHAFDFAFIDKVNASTAQDYIISPLSMQFLLGMLLDGAQGETADEICRVLGYGAGEVEAVNDYCLSLLQQLPALDKKTTLQIANAIFVDDGWPLLDTYTGTVEHYYKAQVSNLDFRDNSGSLKAINGWCKDHTNGLIPKVLDRVDPDMLAYLLNALYFKGQWKEKFPKGATAQETFTDETGARDQKPMMKLEKTFSYFENECFQAVSLPYGNGAFSLLVILPVGKNKVADVTASLKKDWNNLFFREMVPCEVDLWLPRFETSFHIRLNELLSDMGMPSSFDPANADFKAMSDYALCLSFVQQDAVIKVDEEGAEAAVVSSAGMMKNTSMAPGEHVVFHADHPFLYLITETTTKAVLFAGRYGGK